MFNTKLLIAETNKIRYNIVTLDGRHVDKQSTDFILKNNFATLCSIGDNCSRQKQDSIKRQFIK